MKRCRDVMRRNPARCRATDLVERAAEIMETSGGPVHVVDGAGVLVGLFTEQDLTLAVVGRGRNPTRTRLYATMKRTYPFCRVGDTVTSALDLLVSNGLDYVPVVGEDERLAGVIARSDLDDASDCLATA
jgi:CBS domain-containing protein